MKNLSENFEKENNMREILRGNSILG